MSGSGRPTPVRPGVRAAAIALAAFLVAAAAAGQASAQSISGMVRSARDSTPIAGAVVVLLDASGKPLDGTLSRDDGSYNLALHGGGTYGLRLDLVGFQSVMVPPFMVRDSAHVVRDLRLPYVRVSLPGIAITASTACTRVSGESGDAARLWSEAKKTLEATRIAQHERRFPVTVTHYERLVSLPDSIVISSHTSTLSGVSVNPFISLPPESVAVSGYVGKATGRDVYYAPDANVLLSDGFVEGHCFRTRRDGPARMLGLAFTTQNPAGRIDIDGVLWLDSASAELRTLEFEYVPGIGRMKRGSGRVEFGRLPSGVWGVRQWAIRTPSLLIRQSDRRPDGMPGAFADTTVAALQEEGGGIVAGVAAASAATEARVRGMVMDSTSGLPLSDAVVTLEGAGLTVRTDSAGRFAIDSLGGGGTFALRFWHPRLDSLGIQMPRTTVQVRRGEEVTSLLAIPGASTVARARCRPGGAASEGARLLTGIVRDGTSRAPAAGAEILVLERSDGALGESSSREHDAPRLTRRHAFVTENGRYAFCGLADSAYVWVTAHLPGGPWSTPVPIARTTAVAALDLVLPSDSGSAVTSAAPPPMARELARAVIAPQESRVEGWILFPDDPPATPVQILMDGRVVSAALPTGEFLLEQAAGGRRQLAFRAPGFARMNIAVAARNGESLILAVALERSSTLVLAGTVTRMAPGESWRAGFEQRRRSGQGYFLDGEAIRRRGGQTLADLLRGVPGVRLVPVGTGYRYQSTRAGESGAATATGIDAIERCEMMFYVDGQPFIVEEGAVDSNIRADQIAALEVYASAATVPKQFSGARAACGVIVIWRGGS